MKIKQLEVLVKREYPQASKILMKGCFNTVNRCNDVYDLVIISSDKKITSSEFNDLDFYLKLVKGCEHILSKKFELPEDHLLYYLKEDDYTHEINFDDMDCYELMDEF